MATLHNFFGTLRSLTRRLFRREEDARLVRMVDALRATPVFAPLSRGDLWALAETLHPRRYQPDEYLYYEGDPGLGLFVVQRGRVRLLTEAAEGRLVELRQVGEHEVFGEAALFGTGELRRMETAQAVTEAHVLGFFSPDLRTLQRRNPGAAAAVMMAVARHLARRHAALLPLLAEREGKLSAQRLLHEAEVRAEALLEAPLPS